MRTTTTKILLMLTTNVSKKSLLNFWTDIKALSKSEFEDEIHKCQEEVKSATKKIVSERSKSRKTKKTAVLANDSAEARIAYLFKTKYSLSDREAIDKLTLCMKNDGINPNLIPESKTDNFEHWIEELLKNVSASRVMHLALSVKNNSIKSTS